MADGYLIHAHQLENRLIDSAVTVLPPLSFFSSISLSFGITSDDFKIGIRLDTFSSEEPPLTFIDFSSLLHNAFEVVRSSYESHFCFNRIDFVIVIPF